MVKKRKKPEPRPEGPPDVTSSQLNQVLLASKAAPPAYNGAKLTIDLLETATTQTVARMGWFRDVRLRRAADAFMKSCKLYQQPTARMEADGGQGFEKPSHQQIQA